MHLFQAAQVTLKLTELQSQDCLLKQLQFGTEFGRAFVSALLGVSQGDLNLGWYTHCGHDAFNPTWEAEADRSLCKFKADVMFNHMCQLIWLDHSTQYLAKCYPGCFYKGFFFFFWGDCHLTGSWWVMPILPVEAETEMLLRVWGRSSLYPEFQNNQYYRVRLAQNQRREI